MRAALIALSLLCALAAAGCGGARKVTAKQVARKSAPPAGLRVGVVGPVDVVPVAGASLVRGPLETMAAYPLVVVSAEATDAATVAATAAAHPASHFALAGASSAASGWGRRVAPRAQSPSL